MRRRLGLQTLPLLLAAVLAGCSIDIAGSGASLHEEQRFVLSGQTPIDVRLSTFDGDIQVRSWDRNEVLVGIERRGPDQVSAERLTVNAAQNGNTITVEAVAPGEQRHAISLGNWTSRAVHLTVTVPRRLLLQARTGDGRIEAGDLQGSLDLSSGDGRILVSRIDGQVKAHTGDGSIHAEAINGEVDAGSGDGPIEIAGTLSGLSVRTGDGSVNIDASSGSVMKTDWRVTTGDGPIMLRVPAGFSGAVDASTGDGHIRIEGLSDSQNSDGSDRRSLRGQLGSGGQTLRLRTGDGSITVSK